MPRWAHNKMPPSVKRRYFELIRAGHKGADAARRVGVSTSCGSLWFIDAGSVIVPEPAAISARFLTQDDRIAIADGLQAKSPVKTIAASINKSFQTVYREIRRNSKPDGTYQPWWAHNHAVLRRQRPKAERIQDGTALHDLVTAKLDLRWSPQQISRFLKRAFLHDVTMRACAETIYRALFAGRLGDRTARLRTRRRRRRRQRRGVPGVNKIKNMRLVKERPAEINDRRTVGHWEGDLIIGRGQRSAIGTLVERVSRFVVLVHLPLGHKAPFVRDALIERLMTMPPPIRESLTWDQGRELTLHEEIAAATGMDIFFCEPHAPWQRGTNENTNGLIRHYFPKHTDLAVHTAEDLERVALELNQRPRLVLGDLTPQRVLAELTSTSHIT
jgi:IS30 family transposase